MERDERIQQSIYSHGRIKAVRLLNCNEFMVEYADGFAAVIDDPRTKPEGPIQLVELVDGPDQGLVTDFRILKSFVLFAGPNGKRPEGEAIQSTSPALEHA